MRVGEQRQKLWLWIGVGILVLIVLVVVRTLAKRQEERCDEVMASLRPAMERGDRDQTRQHLEHAKTVCKTLYAAELGRIAESLAAADQTEAARRAKIAAEGAAAHEAAEAARRFPDEQGRLAAELGALEKLTVATTFDVAAARVQRDALVAKLAPLKRSAIASSPEVQALLRRVDQVSSRIAATDAKQRAAQAELDQRTAAAAAKQNQEQRRRDFTKALDTWFLDQGWDATVLVRGTTLRIEFALCNRAFLHQLVNKDDTAKPTLQVLGFKLVECSDGYNKSARIDL